MNWFSLSIRVHESVIGDATRKLQEMAEVDGAVEIAAIRGAHVLPPLLPEAPPLAPKKVQQKTLHRGRPRKDGATSALAQSLLVMGETEVAVLRDVMVKKGYSGQSLSGLLNRLLTNKQIVRSKPKTYKLTPKGEKELCGAEGHKEVTKKKNSKYRGKKVNNATGVRGLILSSLMSTPKDGTYLRGLLESNNLSPTNMTGTVAKMMREGLVKSESGQYALTERGANTANGVLQ